MTIHVNIGDAKTRLSELIAAAMRGEEVVVSKAGEPQVRLVPISSSSEETLEARHRKRLSAFGMWRDLDIDADAAMRPSMTDEELEERWQRKFGPAA